MAEMGGSHDGCRVYLITPPQLDPAPFADRLAAALDAGDVAAVQLRLKDVDDDAWRRAIDALRPVTQSRERGVPAERPRRPGARDRQRRRPCRAGGHAGARGARA